MWGGRYENPEAGCGEVDMSGSETQALEGLSREAMSIASLERAGAPMLDKHPQRKNVPRQRLIDMNPLTPIPTAICKVYNDSVMRAEGSCPCSSEEPRSASWSEPIGLKSGDTTRDHRMSSGNERSRGAVGAITLPDASRDR